MSNIDSAESLDNYNSETYKGQPQGLDSSSEGIGHDNRIPHSGSRSLEYLKKAKRMARSAWGTRFTEDVSADDRFRIKTTLRELFVYLVFLALVSITALGMTSSVTYRYTEAMTQLFLDEPIPGSEKTFRYLTTASDFWHYLEGPLINGIFWESWYNNQSLGEEDFGFILYENKLIGVPRIRQLKVTNDSCMIQEDFRNDIHVCYGTYSYGNEDRSQFGKMSPNESAWNYQSEQELGSSSHWGQLATYSGGGYVQDLAHDKAESVSRIDELKRYLWIDRGTRAIFIDFTTYNANINLFFVARLVAEFPATGGLLTSWRFRTVKLIRYVTPFDYFIMACECLLVLFTIYFIVEEILEIKRNGLTYFLSFANLLDIAIIIVSICCFSFNLHRSVVVDQTLHQLLDSPDTFADFDYLSYWHVIFNEATAIFLFFVWLKLFKYISFNETMIQLSATLNHCAKDLAGYALMFIVVFLAFAQLGYLIFGAQLDRFSTFSTTILTLFQIILGDFDFEELESASPILGPVYFILYVFFVFFILLSVFLAIINDSYIRVKDDLTLRGDKLTMTGYVKERYREVKAKVVSGRKVVTKDEATPKQPGAEKKNYAMEEEDSVSVNDYTTSKSGVRYPSFKQSWDSSPQQKTDDFFQRSTLTDDECEEIEFESPAASESFDTTSEPVTTATKCVVSTDEFVSLSRRVDRVEHALGSVVSKIDAIIVRLEKMAEVNEDRREKVKKLVDSYNNRVVEENDHDSESII